MMKKILVGALFLVGAVTLGSAQSNEQLDGLLSQASARLDSTVYLLLTSNGSIPDDADPATALTKAVELGLVSSSKGATGPVTVEDLAYLVMKTQGIPGGLEWTFFPSPRAAYRELSFQKLINTSAGPGRVVAGDEVVRTLTAALNFKGGKK